MNPQPIQQAPIDPATEANNLANLFYGLSQALDDFRLNPPAGTPPEQLGQLKDEAQALDDRAHYFTGQAIGATLQAIQNNLAQVKGVTADATAQVGRLNDVSKIISIATAGLALGASIASGNPVSILSNAQALAQALV
jgi:hypothetical protein